MLYVFQRKIWTLVEKDGKRLLLKRGDTSRWVAWNKAKPIVGSDKLVKEA